MTLTLPDAARPPSVIIHTFSPEAIGFDLAANQAISTSFSTAAWNLANRAFFVPFYIGVPIVVTKLAWSNGVVAGNFDCGLYNTDGTKIISTGSTAMSGASVWQEVDITDTPLQPGAYYMALASNTVTTQTLSRTAVAPFPVLEAAGVMMQDSAFPLPSPATMVHVSATFVPLFGLLRKTTL